MEFTYYIKLPQRGKACLATRIRTRPRPTRRRIRTSATTVGWSCSRSSVRDIDYILLTDRTFS
jgi:hypothetical protein